jgi:hypothetical protein
MTNWARVPRKPVVGIVLVSLVSFVVAPVPVVFADAAQDKVLAGQLFEDSKALMKAGNFKEACPKLEASAKLDPNAGGTVLNLGLCYEGLGRPATACAYFKETITRAKAAVPPRPDREQMAREHLATLEPILSYVTIRVAPDAHVDGLHIELDGKSLDEAVWGSSFPIDPGSHHLAVSAPGHDSWAKNVAIGAKADKQTIDVPKLPAKAASASTVVTAKPGPPDKGPLSKTGTGSDVAAWIALGAGVVFLGGAVVSQVSASSANDSRKAACATQMSESCDDTGKSKVRTWEAVSFVSAGLSAVAFGVSIYLFTSTSSNPNSAAVSSLRVGVVPAAAMPTFALEGAF